MLYLVSILTSRKLCGINNKAGLEEALLDWGGWNGRSGVQGAPVLLVEWRLVIQKTNQARNIFFLITSTVQLKSFAIEGMPC